MLGQISGLYETPISIEPEKARTRIFSPQAYPSVRNVQLVPAAHGEALGLAAWFPTVWHVKGSDAELVAVRSLLGHGRGHPSGSPSNPASLPLVLKAYPFLLDGEPHGGSTVHVAFDSAMPDRATDAGAPIMTSPGKYSRAAEIRLRSLAHFAKLRPTTKAISTNLLEGGHLEPWRLKYQTEEGEVAIEDLYALRSEAGHDRSLFSLFDRFGPLALNLIGAHRLSLYRAGVLVRAAEKALRSAEPKA